MKCKHNQYRTRCKECGGGSICEHKRRRYTCRECKGGRFCEHSRQCNTCSICKPSGAFKLYKYAATQKNQDFTLSLDDFKSLVIQPCVYCGEQEKPRGIDRWDNSIGYTLENSRPCCEICNYAKRMTRGDLFVEWLQRAANYTKGKL